MHWAGLMQLKQHGGGKELEGCELPARTAGFTLLPSVLPVLPGALQGRDCLLFCVRMGSSLGCSLVNVRYTE